MASTQDNSDNTCVVCFKNVDYYSLGECDHPVCYECSTRMRVLCLQNECPICRQELARVIFTPELQNFKKLKTHEFACNQYERKYKISFTSDEVYKAYLTLLEHRCRKCDSTVAFKSFETLHDHMKKDHELFYCDLCIANLKIFTFERKCYTRQALALHRRKGDPDDTSHRGHPMCQFCQLRYMDNDDLFRHLRKQHLYCHLCDADGFQHYYDTHMRLFDHYRQDHFVCEEGECHDQHLTGVFRTEIDLKAHKASVHGRGLPRAAARQARTLEWHFSLTPRPPPQHQQHHQNPQASRGDHANANQHQRPASFVEPPEEEVPEEEICQVAAAAMSSINTRSIEQFPSLSGRSTSAPAVPLTNIVPPSAKGRNRKGYKENFPALDANGAPGPAPVVPGPAVRFNITHQQTPAGPSPAVIRTSSKPNVSIQVPGHEPTANNFRLTQASTSKPSPVSRHAANWIEDDFPTLSLNDNHPSVGSGTLQKSKVAVVSQQDLPTKQTSNTHTKGPAPTKSDEAFPALSGLSSSPALPPTWITVKNKDKAKKSKVTPPPDLTPPPQQNFDSVADFPTLKTKAKNKKNPDKTKANNSTSQTIVQNGDSLQGNETLQNDFNDKQIEIKSQNGKKKKKGKENSVSTNGQQNKLSQKPSLENGSLKNMGNINQALEHKQTPKENIPASSKAKNSSNASSNKGHKTKNSFEVPKVNIDKTNAIQLSNVNDKTKSTIKKTSAETVSSSTSNRPPGFDIMPPPGFSSAPACDGLTFTNSSGQSFFAPQHQFVHPPDFDKRNVEIISKFATALGSIANIEEFKKLSQGFREGFMSGLTFYMHCVETMGAQFEELFPELVALLPDIQKQQELQLARCMRGGNALPACAVCGQVLIMEDSVSHARAHWPSLPNANALPNSARINRKN